MTFAFCGPTAQGLPDAGQGACCIGSAMRGREYCTCWKPIYDRRAQRKPLVVVLLRKSEHDATLGEEVAV